MKTLKLVLGILCIVLSALVTFQSCAVGLGNALMESEEISGFGGTVVAIGMLVGGIVMLVTRKSSGKGGSVACMILFLLAAGIGFISMGTYTDLKVWSSFCLILAAVNLLALFGRKKAAAND